MTATYLINKMPTPIFQGKSPYTILYKKPVVYDHLRVFGCLCFASTLPKGDKFKPRAKRVVFIGYSETQKGYKLFDLQQNTYWVSRDVVFREDIFPFKGITYEGTTIFDVPHSFNDHHHPNPTPIPMPASHALVYDYPSSSSDMPEVADNMQHSIVEADEVPPVEHLFPPVPLPVDLRRTTRSANPPI